MVCCDDVLLTLSGASYTTISSKRSTSSPAGNTTIVAPDSYVWVDNDKSYYISMANETKSVAIEAMRQLKDFINLASFMKTHAEVVKSESENISGVRRRKRSS